MVIPMIFLLAAAVFVTQLVFCFYAKRLWIKLLPLGVALAMDAICWGLYFSGTFVDVHGGDFASFVYGIVLLIVAAVAGIGWGTYGIVKVVQNRRKTFVM